MDANLQAILDKTIESVSKAYAYQRTGQKPDDGSAAKFTMDSTLGIYGISLEDHMKSMVPFLDTPWRNVPRFVVPTGEKHTFKRITKVSVTGKTTAARGTRGNAGAITGDYIDVAFGILSGGLFSIDYETERASGSFDNALAKLTAYNALHARNRVEPAHILGGNVVALGAVTNIAAAQESSVTTTLANATKYVNVKALTAEALQRAVLAGACILPGTDAYHSVAGVAATVDQTCGWGVEGSEASANPNLKGLKITWDAIAGAVAYGVFVGTSSGITNLKCVGVTGQTYITLTASPTGGSAGISGDNSADANDFPGLLALLAASGSGAYKRNLGASLSAAVGNGIPEIDTMISACFQQALGIDKGKLVVGTQDRALLTRMLGQGASNSLIRINVNASAENNSFMGGAFADKYVHPITNRIVPIETDPYLYAGTILWVPEEIPFPMADVVAPMYFALSYDWANFAYAVTDPARYFENRMRGGLAVPLPPAFGLLYNVYNG